VDCVPFRSVRSCDSLCYLDLITPFIFARHTVTYSLVVLYVPFRHPVQIQYIEIMFGWRQERLFVSMSSEYYWTLIIIVIINIKTVLVIIFCLNIFYCKMSCWSMITMLIKRYVRCVGLCKLSYNLPLYVYNFYSIWFLWTMCLNIFQNRFLTIKF